MPFSTKAELRTSIKAWSKRTELTDAQIDDFIVLFEADVARRLRVRAMENRDSAFTISSELTALPTGYRAMRSIFLDASPANPLRLISPETALDSYDRASTGQPVAYYIEGSNFVAVPAPDGSYTGVMTYYKALDALTDSVTNWLFTNHPDCYLFGALAHTAPFIGEDERTVWAGMFEGILGAISAEDNRGRWSGSQPLSRVRNTP